MAACLALATSLDHPSLAADLLQCAVELVASMSFFDSVAAILVAEVLIVVVVQLSATSIMGHFSSETWEPFS